MLLSSSSSSSSSCCSHPPPPPHADLILILLLLASSSSSSSSHYAIAGVGACTEPAPAPWPCNAAHDAVRQKRPLLCTHGTSQTAHAMQGPRWSWSRDR
eukprot:2704012-Rhodomonas_salina.4